MRSTFPEYFRPSNNDFDELWRSAYFAFDSNVLLAPYRYSESTRRQLLDVLKRLRDRIWIPHQVAFEFLRNRHQEIADSTNRYKELSEDLEATVKKLKEKHRRHGFLDLDDVWRRFDEAARFVTDAEQQHPHLWDEDPIQVELAGLFEGRVGEPLTLEARNRVISEAKDRFARRQPPGWKDAEKDGDRKYGDLILWKQFLAQAATKAPAPWILVTEDAKEDWWWRVSGRTVGPHPELIAEMRSEAKVSFYMYRLDTFLEQAGRYLAAQTKALEEAVVEVRDVALERHLRGVDAFESARTLMQRLSADLAPFTAYKEQIDASLGPLLKQSAALRELLAGVKVPPHIQRFIDAEQARTARLAFSQDAYHAMRDEARLREMVERIVGDGRPDLSGLVDEPEGVTDDLADAKGGAGAHGDDIGPEESKR